MSVGRGQNKFLDQEHKCCWVHEPCLGAPLVRRVWCGEEELVNRDGCCVLNAVEGALEGGGPAIGVATDKNCSVLRVFWAGSLRAGVSRLP